MAYDSAHGIGGHFSPRSKGGRGSHSLRKLARGMACDALQDEKASIRELIDSLSDEGLRALYSLCDTLRSIDDNFAEDDGEPDADPSLSSHPHPKGKDDDLDDQASKPPPTGKVLGSPDKLSKDAASFFARYPDAARIESAGSFGVQPRMALDAGAYSASAEEGFFKRYPEARKIGAA